MSALPEGDNVAASACDGFFESGWGDIPALSTFASECDVVTWEFENVPLSTVAAIPEAMLAPHPKALEIAQDRLNEKRFVEELGLDAIHAYETDLQEYAWNRLHEIPGMKIHGPALEHRGPILSFTMEGAHPEDLAQLLDRKGVFVRHGHHCTMPLHQLMGVPATVRVSLAMYNNRQDIDQLMDGLAFARKRLRLTD